jgi:nucleotide-binding universal stress UspA family protein
MPNRTIYKKILVPIDGSGWSEYAIPHAADIARTHKAEVILFHVYHDPAANYVDSIALAGQSSGLDQAPHDIEQKLTSLVHELKSEGIDAHASLASGSAVTDIICDFVRQEGIDLVVMTSRGHTGIARALFGSTAREVLERVNVPVILLQPSKEQS